MNKYYTSQVRFSFLTTIIIIPAIILLIVRFQTFEVSSDQSFIYWGKFVFELNNNTQLNYLTILYGNFMRWYSYNASIFGKLTFILSFDKPFALEARLIGFKTFGGSCKS